PARKFDLRRRQRRDRRNLGGRTTLVSFLPGRPFVIDRGDEIDQEIDKRRVEEIAVAVDDGGLYPGDQERQIGRQSEPRELRQTRAAVAPAQGEVEVLEVAALSVAPQIGKVARGIEMSERRGASAVGGPP